MFGMPPIWVFVKYYGYSLSEHTPLQAVVVEKNKYRGYFNKLFFHSQMGFFFTLASSCFNMFSVHVQYVSGVYKTMHGPSRRISGNSPEMPS